MKLFKFCCAVAGLFVSLTYAWADSVNPQTLRIEDAFVVFYQGETPGAGYMIIRQMTNEDDQLLSVRLADQQNSCVRIELHDHVSEKIDGHDVKKMVALAAVTVPAASGNGPGLVAFAPGGKHLMLYDFPKSLKESKKITLILTFKKAGEMAVDFEIRTPSTLAAKNDNKNNCGCCHHKD